MTTKIRISLDYSQVGMESSKLIQKSKILKEEGEEGEQTENQSYVISLQDEIEQEGEEEENEYITQKSLQKQFSNLNLSEQSMISSVGSLMNSKVRNKFLNKSHQVQEERPLIKRRLVKGNTQILDNGIKKIKKVVNILKFKSVFGKVKVKIALRDKKNKLLDKEIEEYQRLNKILDQEEIDITDSDNANVLIDLLHSSHKSNREKNFMKNYIQQIPFFLKFQNQFLSRQETVEKLISHLNHKYYQQRTILMNRGDPGKNFYIILKGGCTVLIPKQKKQDEIQARKDWKPKLLNTQFFKRVLENLYRVKIVSADRIEQHLFYLYGNFSSAEIGADGYFNQLDKSKQDPKLAKKMQNFKKMALNIGHVSELFNSKKSKKLAFQFLLCPDIKPVQFEKMEYHEFLEKKFPDMMRILEYKSGDSFGEIALLTDGTRQATIVLREDTHFMVLNKTAFRALIGTYNMIIFQENLAFYKQFSFFKLLPESVLNEITKSTISKIFYRNQYIYKEGGDNKYIYFIRYGEVEIKRKMKGESQDQNQVQIQEIDQEFKKINNFKRNKKAQLLAISKLGQNQFFGEKQGEKREEYVQVFSSEIECFLLDKQILYKYLEHYKLLDEFLQFQEQKNNWQEKQEKEVNLIKMNKVNFTDTGQNLEFNQNLKNWGENYHQNLNEKNIKQENNINNNNKLGPFYFQGDKNNNMNDFQNIENYGDEGEKNLGERKSQNQNLNETKDVIFYYNQRKQQQKELQEQIQQKQIKIQELQQQQQQLSSGIQDRKISSNFEQSVKLYQCGKNFQNQSNSNQNNDKISRNNERIQEQVEQIKNMQLSNQKQDKSKTQFSNMDLSKSKERKMPVLDKIQQESQNSQIIEYKQFSKNSIQRQMSKKSQNFGISQFDSKKFNSIQKEQVNFQSAKKNLNIQFQKYSQNSQELVPLSHRTYQEKKGSENLEDVKNSIKFNKNSQKENENLEIQNFENIENYNQNNENGQIENELNFSKKKEKKMGFNCRSDTKLNPLIINPSQSQKLLKSQHFINLGSGHFSKNYYLSEKNTKTCINFNNGNSINKLNFSESVQNWKNQDQICEKNCQDEELQSFLMNEISVYKKNLKEQNQNQNQSQNQNQNQNQYQQNRQLEKFSLKNFGRQVRGGRILKEQKFGNQNLRKIRNYHKKFLEEIQSERKCQSQTFLKQHSSFQDFKLQGQQKQNQNQNDSQIFENNGLAVKSKDNFGKKEIYEKKQKWKNYQIQNQLVQEREKINENNKINNYYSEFIEKSQDIKQKKCNNNLYNCRNNDKNNSSSNNHRIGNQEGQSIFIEQKQKYDNYYSNKSGIGEIKQKKERNQSQLQELQKNREIINQNESKIEEQKSYLNRNLLFQNGN
ncbi:Cyclic nucleotide-binding protein [Pseudocohnilembus persalinus]|uniref:Cyclic nucleotide-binding protein n=1 Tax=Pseudocohnilembus persalinus TaxID=266149 RepID=A0A0V0Q832_PSEPJ|nr:Cyclic nucleotide-binding protein [Pseudocohnilembus persalinus]|eukprot:KRW98408.1 Cyclic nucleotide-binding protein [Pseudocohnilembus persalinus]